MASSSCALRLISAFNYYNNCIKLILDNLSLMISIDRIEMVPIVPMAKIPLEGSKLNENESKGVIEPS